jgi:hypothetical protein
MSVQFIPARPSCPNVGFTFSLNTSSLSPGSHTITATDSDTLLTLALLVSR